MTRVADVQFLSNPVYTKLLQEFRSAKKKIWNADDLVDEFGQESTDELVNSGFLVKSKSGTVTLAFEIEGTVSHLIKQMRHKEKFEKDMPNLSSEKLGMFQRFLDDFEV